MSSVVVSGLMKQKRNIVSPSCTVGTSRARPEAERGVGPALVVAPTPVPAAEQHHGQLRLHHQVEVGRLGDSMCGLARQA